MDGKGLHRPPEGWTLDTLASHLVSVVTTLLGETDKRYEQRFTAQESATEKALNAQEKAIAAALAAAKEAVTKAEVAVEKRFDNTNEWRESLRDREANQMPRVEIQQRFDAIYALLKWTIGIAITTILGLAGVLISLKH